MRITKNLTKHECTSTFTPFIGGHSERALNKITEPPNQTRAVRIEYARGSTAADTVHHVIPSTVSSYLYLLALPQTQGKEKEKRREEEEKREEN
jgi:hypothetical protein